MNKKITILLVGFLYLVAGTAFASAEIVVPPGFSVQAITSGANLDIAPGQGGAFGMDVYYIDEAASPNNIMRVNPEGGPSTFFASVPSAITLAFGFGGDLFAAEGAWGAVNGDLWRIASDGSVSFFASIPTFVEGMAFSSGGPFGTNLYVSEFGPGTIKAVDSSGSTTILTGPGTIGTTPTGLEFGPGGAFGTDLYVIDRYGTIYTVTSTGVSSLFAGIDFGPLIYRAETLAFGRPTTLFGENLFVAEEGTPGKILKISPTGVLTTFASGFPGFSTGGVTGLEFSKDGNTLFVTDDQTATVYAITATLVEVDIDIKPGSDQNTINLGSAGVVPTAILSSATFDATQVDPNTISLAGASVKVVGKGNKFLCHEDDVNSDNFVDLVCQLETVQFIIEEGQSNAVLEGKTFDGLAIHGEDFIRIVP